MTGTDPYNALGVSSSKEDVHTALGELDPPLYPGAFCHVVASGEDHLAILHADGAGTKAIIAYLQYRETGSLEGFRSIATDSAVMNIDDMVCVGAVDDFLLSNTIGRDRQRIGGDVLKAIFSGYRDFCRRLSQAGCSVTMCGGETADVGDLVKTVIVDSTVYARFPRANMIDCSRIRGGLAIIGISSAGRASYEDAENSGIGSNGFTLARHTLLHGRYGRDYPETRSDLLAEDATYRGKFTLDDPLPRSEMSIGEALLSPTRSHAPIIKAVLENNRDAIHGIIHCTGGGLVKSLSFGTGVHYVKDNLFDQPPIFKIISAEGQVSPRDMWRTFNNGHRIEIYCTVDAADSVISVIRGFDVDAQLIGRTEEAPDGANRVTISAGKVTETYVA